MATAIQSFKIPSRKRFTRFLLVGAGGTILDFSVLTGLKMLGLPTLQANTLSFSVGVTNNFIWNRLWTFADARRDGWRRQFSRFLLVSLAGLILNNLLVVLLEPRFEVLFGWTQFGYLPAKAVATGMVVFWNYFANRHWTFSFYP